ncbi:hypothetical protein VU11_02430, partial [Desulfobulbus sp. US2]|nr:hypothetical protein [Desulfobulbus sp. US2]
MSTQSIRVARGITPSLLDITLSGYWYPLTCRRVQIPVSALNIMMPRSLPQRDTNPPSWASS